MLHCCWPAHLPSLQPLPLIININRQWLGRWDADLARVTDLVELMLHADFDDAIAQQQPGNAEVAARLREIASLEKALWAPSGADGAADARHLAYARAAAAVKACRFSVAAAVRGGNGDGDDGDGHGGGGGSLRDGAARLAERVPFLSGKIAADAAAIALTGSCARLDALRAGRAVSAARPDSAGAAARRALAKLPGVGAVRARRLLEAGVTSLAALEAAASDAAWLTEGAGARCGLRADIRHAVRGVWRRPAR